MICQVHNKLCKVFFFVKSPWLDKISNLIHTSNIDVSFATKLVYNENLPFHIKTIWYQSNKLPSIYEIPEIQKHKRKLNAYVTKMTSQTISSV